MKATVFLFVVLFTTDSFSFCHLCAGQKLTGPYLGQKPAGMIPEIFAPGIISKEGIQGKLSVTPDGSELIYMTMDINQEPGNARPQRHIRFIRIKKRDCCWQDAEVIPFSCEYANDEPSLSYDGNTLFFVSDRPESENGRLKGTPDIWFVEKNGDTWSEPHNVGSPVNTDGVEAQPFYAADGKLYFGRTDGLYCSQHCNGKFTEPVILDEKIFKGRLRGVCLSPDNEILIVHSDMPGGYGNWDLYISFKDQSGNWTSLTNMGKNINTELPEANATFSPDGKYLFFSRGDDIYWVSANTIEELRCQTLSNK